MLTSAQTKHQSYRYAELNDILEPTDYDKMRMMKIKEKIMTTIIWNVLAVGHLHQLGTPDVMMH